MRVCQIGWAGQPWARNPKTHHFDWLGLGRPGPPRSTGPGQPRRPKPSPLSTRPGPAWPTRILHFCRRGQAHPSPSLLLARPHASIVQARPRNPSHHNPPNQKPCQQNGHPLFPGLAPSLFDKPSGKHWRLTPPGDDITECEQVPHSDTELSSLGHCVCSSWQSVFRRHSTIF